jgi:uncharacterized protein YndB with AHSA1/START domain
MLPLVWNCLHYSSFRYTLTKIHRMSYSIKHLFHVDASIEKVFAAISTIKGLSNWWTTQTTGSVQPGGIIQFRFGDMGGPDMKITGIEPNKSVSWECVDSPHGWVGHTISISLDENEGKTRVRFSHDGWEQQDDFHAICNFSWALYMKSLKAYCQAGSGEAFGTESHRK